MKYSKIGLTHVIEFDPMEIYAARTIEKSTKIVQQYKNFVNANFFYHSIIIGWLISEGKIISRRDEYLTWKGNPKGTLIVYKDGTVECGLKYDKEIAEDLQNIWFCCQGFNLFPFDLKQEGLLDKSIARSTNRVSIGYNAASKKVILAVRPLSNASRALRTMKNLGCDTGICLDSGSSANLYKDGKALLKTGSTLTNILYWN